MNENELIAVLTADLTPVRPIWSPAWRALAWLCVVAAGAAGLAWVADMGEVRARMAEAPDLRYAAAGSVLTAGLAALASFELSVPGRSVWWLAVPVPALGLWVGASGWGCLRSWTWPGLTPTSFGESWDCVVFITVVSAPLSALLLWMVSRACPLWPGRVAAMGGLAAAAAAASLLTFFHPFDASAVDLLMHAAAVGVVIGVCRLLGTAFG